MTINNAFTLGEFVYLKTDPDQFKRILVGIQITHEGLLYKLACNMAETWHYEIEISTEKDMLMLTENGTL